MPSSRIWSMVSVCLALLLVAAHAEAQCSYTSVQARVQLNVQDPWKQTMTLPQGTPFHVGAFKNGWGQFVDCCNTTLQVTSPNGVVSNVANDSYFGTPQAGTYTLRVSCPPHYDTATVTAIAETSCPYTSVQARVQRNLQDPWKTSMTVFQGENFHIGAMKNGWGQFVDCCNNTILRVTAPNGVVTTPPNDSYLNASQIGTYTIRAICGSLSDTAYVTVVPLGSACPYGSIQARIQLHEQDAWRQSVTLVQGQRFRIGGFYDSTSILAPNGITLQVTGPNGYILNPPVNGVYVDAPYAGTYTLRATCDHLSDSASVNAVATTSGIPVQRPNINGIGVAWGSQWNLNQATTARTWDRNNLDKIAEAGSLTTHVSFDWVGIETSNNTFNWSYVDHQVNEAEARGLLMLGYTGNTPNWALASSQAGNGHRFPPQEQWSGEFESFFQTLAQRYCGRVRYYEFWNEPNGCSWVGEGCAGNSGDAEVQLYVRWLQRWYRAMKRGCPDTVLLTGGLDCHLGTNCRQWLDQVYRFGGREYFDGVAIHPYGEQQNPTTATALNFGTVDEMSAELAENGQAWKKLWLDEWGYTTSNEGLKGQMIDHVLRQLADNTRYPNVFQARYLTVSDLPSGNPLGSDNTRGLAQENLTSLTLSPRLSWSYFQDRALGLGNEVPLANKRMETNGTAQYGRIASWGPNGAWAYHRIYPRPNNQNLGQSFAYYSAGTTETVGQIVPGLVFQPGKTYTFKGWVHGGGDNTGVVPFQIGYAAVAGNLSSFQPLATVPVTVGNTWFESSGVSWTSFTIGAELGKQIIVRLGAGGSTDIWFDNLKLIVNP